jgi:hypothetical protein
MNRVSWTVVAGLVGLTLAVGTTARAQQGPLTADALQRQRQQAPQTLSPNLIVVDRRPPIPFKPFEMVDVVTHNPIPPDSILTLPDGKSAPAKVYFEKLNEIEKGLNAIGYTLRDDWSTITVQHSAVNTSALTQSARRIRSSVDASKPFKVPTFAEFNQRAAPQPPMLVGNPDLARNIPSAPGAARPGRPGAVTGALDKAKVMLPPPHKKKPPITSVNEFPFAIGDPNVLAASVNGRLELTGSEDNMKLTGGASAGVSIFGISSDVARLNGYMNAPKTGAMSGKVSLDVLPFGTIYNLDLNGASVSKEDNISRSADVEFANFVVMIGPVPVRVKTGAEGSVGLKYYAGLNPASAVGEIAPLIHSKLYVQAGLDVIVAGAGAGADLTLLNYDLSMYGAIRTWIQTPDGGTTPELGIREQVQMSQKLTMLNGSAYAFAYIYVPRCCVPPWKKKEWRWDIFTWDGFTPVDGTLADYEKWTSLGLPAK